MISYALLSHQNSRKNGNYFVIAMDGDSAITSLSEPSVTLPGCKKCAQFGDITYSASMSKVSNIVSNINAACMAAGKRSLGWLTPNITSFINPVRR